MIDKTLEDYLEKQKKRTFKWGQTDCVLFVCDWCKIRANKDPSNGAKGKYSTEEEAYQYLKEHHKGLRTGFNKAFESVDINFRQKGDICLADVDGEEVMGICLARTFVAFKMAPKGIRILKDPKIYKVWRVE